jgi:mannose-6-phosphate isomerase-like protein (cupin superfamily)
MKLVNSNDIGGDIVKDNSTYLLKDNKLLNNLVLSSTFLKAKQHTTGHKHEGQEEVYFFMKGKGEMEIDDKRFPVSEGDIVLIEDGEFHRVYNTSFYGLTFICVFDGKRSH